MTSRHAARPRLLALGIAVAGFYVMVAVATQQLAGRPLRPLFDGFAPPMPYKWVNPPAEFRRDNQRPDGTAVDVKLDAGGSPATNVTTPDTQAIAGLDIGSVPGHFPDTTARLELSPVDPASLAKLPRGIRPEGNAYQVIITYEPSATPVTALAKPGTIALTAAAPVAGLVFSADGKQWTEVDSRPFGVTNGQLTPMTAAGYYMPFSRNPPRAETAKPNHSLLVRAGIIAIAGAFLALLIGIWCFLRRRRQAGPSSSSRPGRSRQRPRGS